ncbi:MAG: tRNA 4-thiouridine(8) synthase ThiI [Oscillospiraceae bacterium]|nr:tRNA 4-thiouridine(8) synthase ThiI [Oscillospiraceae bacterium]
MDELILLKCGEIALKGLNRSSFEDALIKNARAALRPVGEFRFKKAQATVYAEPAGDCDMAEALRQLSKVFGISALCRARIAPKDFPRICEIARGYLADELSRAGTFKVEAKRADKKFHMTSPEICRELGGFLLSSFPHLKVDVNSPEITVVVEIRDFAAYIHTDQLTGAGGIPVGTGGRAALLLSGGIDSPVAGYMMAKRGVSLIGVHFASPPYTSERSLQKVRDLCTKLTPYCGRIPLFTVPFTRIQEQIRELCPEDLLTLIMRRFMMEIAERIALRQDCAALVTGESVGQVASQTLQALACTEAAVHRLPVLRPVS